jgi:hypothetical protein
MNDTLDSLIEKLQLVALIGHELPAIRAELEAIDTQLGEVTRSALQALSLLGDVADRKSLGP